MTIAALILLFGCSRGQEEETVKISDIHKKQGVPVEVEKVAPKKLVISKKYSGTLRGKEEAMAAASIGGNIDRILVTVGQYVQKDQVIAQYREDAAASQYRQAKAAYDNSLENLTRMEALFEAGAISRQTLDNVRTGHEVTVANYEATQKQIFILAPISGYVGGIFVNEGDGVSSRDPVATITDIKDLSIEINVPQSDIGYITKKTGVRVLPTNGYDKTFEGRISRIAMSASMMTRNFKVDIDVDNPEKLLRSGIIAEVELDLVEKDNTIYVLRETLSEQDGKSYLYVIADGKAQQREVQTGQRSGLVVEITGGLNVGDILVTSGQSLLSNGAKVNIVNKEAINTKSSTSQQPTKGTEVQKPAAPAATETATAAKEEGK